MGVGCGRDFDALFKVHQMSKASDSSSSFSVTSSAPLLKTDLSTGLSRSTAFDFSNP